MTIGNMEKMMQELTNDNKSLKKTLQIRTKDLEVCRTNIISKCKENDTTKAKLCEMKTIPNMNEITIQNLKKENKTLNTKLTKKKVKLGNVKTESQIKIQRLEKELKKSVKSKDDLNEITRRYELYQQKNELKSECRKFDEEHYLVSKNLDIFKEKNTVKNIEHYDEACNFEGNQNLMQKMENNVSEVPPLASLATVTAAATPLPTKAGFAHGSMESFNLVALRLRP